jgi:UrcA family protein
LEKTVAKARQGVIMKAPDANRCVLLGMAVLAAAPTANLAMAATRDEAVPKQAIVKFKDLDLSRPQDARRLYGRIKRAASDVCENGASSDIHRLMVYESCIRKAVADAVARLQSSQVTALEQADLRLSQN